MATTVDALQKSTSKLLLAWSPVLGVQSYNLYGGLVNLSGSLVLLKTTVPPITSQKPGEVGKIAVEVTIEEVRTTLSLTSIADFSNTQFFFAVTSMNTAGVWSAIADSPIATIPPVGITIKYQKDDPGGNRHMFGFSEEAWRWVKVMASSGGALVTDSNAFYAMNTVTAYTYDTTNVSSMKIFLSDHTTAGSPAKLYSYEYTGSLVSKVTVTDSTV